MELNEVFRRIVGEHWKVIALCFLAGIAGALALNVGKGPLYTASARVVLDTTDPESRAEAAAIADTAKAIATSPGQVALALTNAHISGHDPAAIAEHHVSVSGLGSSGVFELSVSDPEPDVAIALANALAGQLIRARLASTQGNAQQALAQLDRQLADVNSRLALVNSRIASLNERLAAALPPQRVDELIQQREEALRTRASVTQELSTLETQRSGIVSDDSLRPKPVLLSRALPPARAEASRMLPDLVLGGLLGLIVGVGIAGLLEMFRPTLVGTEVLAREFHAPVLGALPAPPDTASSFEHAGGLAGRLRLAADAAALQRVALVAADGKLDTKPLAEHLQAASLYTGNGSSSPALLSTHSSRGLRVQPFVPGAAPISNGSRAGLVLVVPATVKKAELAETQHLLATGNLPLLGLITYPREKQRLRPSWAEVQPRIPRRRQEAEDRA